MTEENQREEAVFHFWGHEGQKEVPAGGITGQDQEIGALL